MVFNLEAVELENQRTARDEPLVVGAAMRDVAHRDERL
jgi:hypothetical protein